MYEVFFLLNNFSSCLSWIILVVFALWLVQGRKGNTLHKLLKGIAST